MSDPPQLERAAPRGRALAEVALIFAIFFVQGAHPVPDVNEPYYLAKAIHYWNPQWIQNDFFLQSADAHAVFYFTFGWLARWLPPLGLAWFGRVLTWGLLAWAWRRLSVAVLPRPSWAVLTAALFALLQERMHMAGEWVIGGVEAKGFAFVLVLLGLEALVRSRWNRSWLLLGAASGFHVLVGGWSVAAAGLAWLMLPADRPRLRTMWPGLSGGLLLSLPALVPSLALGRGAPPETVSQANLIYVYYRLAHHLWPGAVSFWLVARFALLVLGWGWLCLAVRMDASQRRLRAFVLGSLVIALAGIAIGVAGIFTPARAAGLLRFYWFRLADVAVPLGVALLGAAAIAGLLERRPAVGRRWLGVAAAVAMLHVGVHAVWCLVPQPPRAFRLTAAGSFGGQIDDYVNWRLACDWVAHSGRIPADARFVTPRLSQTFKWYAGRAEVANWKEIPQDSAAIVEWWQRIEDIYATGSTVPGQRWHESLDDLGAERLVRVGRKYGAQYAITLRSKRALPLPIVYRNKSYIVYRLPD